MDGAGGTAGRPALAKTPRMDLIDDPEAVILRHGPSNVSLRRWGFPESIRPDVDPDPNEGSAGTERFAITCSRMVSACRVGRYRHVPCRQTAIARALRR